MNPLNRRYFLKAGSLGLTGAIALPSLAKAVNKKALNNAPDQLTILFQGDSITDAGRDRSHYYPNDTTGMGRGYVFQIVSQLLGSHPDKDWQYYNRGISGNKVYQLAARWEDDCLQLKPDVLSILIGVNDFWHTLNNYDGTVDIYESDFRKLLDRTLTQFPNLKIIIGEPFAVKGGSAINERWFPEFPKYQEAAKKIAIEYNTAYIPYQQIFDEALALAPVDYWCPDGVHPSMAGGYLMKEAWIKSFEELY
jgi:lysophospholipase L1-like esterase